MTITLYTFCVQEKKIKIQLLGGHLCVLFILLFEKTIKFYSYCFLYVYSESRCHHDVSHIKV